MIVKILVNILKQIRPKWYSFLKEVYNPLRIKEEKDSTKRVQFMLNSHDFPTEEMFFYVKSRNGSSCLYFNNTIQIWTLGPMSPIEYFLNITVRKSS